MRDYPYITKFFFENNKAQFEKFADKIRYIKVDDFPELSRSKSDIHGNKWLYENYQRDAIMRGLSDCKDDDIVIISDLDEIPNPEAVKQYKNGICILKQYTFSLQYQDVSSQLPRLWKYPTAFLQIVYCSLCYTSYGKGFQGR